MICLKIQNKELFALNVFRVLENCAGTILEQVTDFNFGKDIQQKLRVPVSYKMGC